MRRVGIRIHAAGTLGLMALMAPMAGCTLDGAEKAAKVGGKNIARKDSARVAKYPACTKRRKRRMITFNQTVDPVRMITVAGVGDVLLHDSVQRFAAFRPGGFANLFNPVADLIRAADVSFANLEGPAAEGVSKTGRKVKTGNRRYDGRVYSGYPMFNYHPSIVGDLKTAGFDVLLTANNHTLDRYAAGADKTIDAITKAGIAFTGTRKKGDKASPWHAITPVTQGRRTWNIAWLGCTYGTNGIPDRHGQVLHCYKQRAVVLKTVAALAKRRDVHAVMFVPHWGPEYRHAPDANQRLLARQVLEAGATAVIGSHPHVMQPIEKYVTRDKRETVIAYSLGNFVSNQIGLARRASAILLLGLKPSGDKLVMAAMGWVPILDAQRRRPDAGGGDRPGRASQRAPGAPAAPPARRQPASPQDAVLPAHGLPHAAEDRRDVRAAQPQAEAGADTGPRPGTGSAAPRRQPAAGARVGQGRGPVRQHRPALRPGRNR